MVLTTFPINPGYVVVAVIGIALAVSWRRARRRRDATETPSEQERKGRC
jgi:membrane protein implicated in regulation of membrane protease activity